MVCGVFGGYEVCVGVIFLLDYFVFFSVVESGGIKSVERGIMDILIKLFIFLICMLVLLRILWRILKLIES